MVQMNARFKEEPNGNGTMTTGKVVKGNIKINGEVYQAKCDCSQDAIANAMKQKENNCQKPEKYKLFYERKSSSATGMKADDLLRFLGKPSDLEWVDVKSRSLSDIDGRMPGTILASPGGDLGEFIVAFQVYEDMMGKTDNVHDSMKFLLNYLNATKPRRFMFHTTKDAVQGVEDDLQETGVNILSPQDRMKERLLGKKCTDPSKPCGLLDPANIGCAHLSLMMRHPERYHVSTGLISETLQAFFSLLWDEDQPSSKQLAFQVLPSKHAENAFVDIRVSPACAEQGRAPLVAANKENLVGDMMIAQSVFLRHPDAGTFRRRELADFFSKQDTTHHIKEEDMFGRIQQLASNAVELTARQVARDLPIYSVTVL